MNTNDNSITKQKRIDSGQKVKKKTTERGKNAVQKRKNLARYIYWECASSALKCIEILRYIHSEMQWTHSGLIWIFYCSKIETQKYTTNNKALWFPGPPKVKLERNLSFRYYFSLTADIHAWI